MIKIMKYYKNWLLFFISIISFNFFLYNCLKYFLLVSMFNASIYFHLYCLVCLSIIFFIDWFINISSILYVNDISYANKIPELRFFSFYIIPFHQIFFTLIISGHQKKYDRTWYNKMKIIQLNKYCLSDIMDPKCGFYNKNRGDIQTISLIWVKTTCFLLEPSLFIVFKI